MKHYALMVGALWLAGCSSMPKPANVDFAAPRVAQAAVQPATRPATGSLFQNASYRPSFEDRRARQVGDTLTVRIVENVTASQKSSSTANRSSSIDGSITAVPGMKFPGTVAENNFRIGAASEADFSGKGGTEAANTFSGSITTTVAEVLPNGHLVVTGEKQIGLNHNVDVLRFTGTVDPLAILPGSIVNSSAVANVRVESKGRGPQHEAQTVGWLTRFFFNISPF
ncbi:flagellar basal body L-ring protein FlgH [Methyloversatilis sp.]|uniref:flagellar basal body L-ring protein FlgH n=1 Tax=Methyloversatilis sp. TaxID=2569862 RepID=UPI002735A9D2|nr:flagellar basal body L-ring protein FlgH [Methyloversatilis sp.]MDP3577784.1 flagellar basal body L-ring protein FlgH [Methyloversatilis sp.]